MKFVSEKELKDYLSEATGIDLLITERLCELKAQKRLYSQVGAESRGAAAKVCKHIAEAEERLNREIDRFYDRKEEIKLLIRRLPSLEEQAIIERHYILGQSWEQIAEECYTSTRTVYNIHNRALSRLLKMTGEEAG